MIHITPRGNKHLLLTTGCGMKRLLHTTPRGMKVCQIKYMFDTVRLIFFKKSVISVYFNTDLGKIH